MFNNHFELLQAGVSKWNQRRRTEPWFLPDLGGEDLRGLNLDKIDLGGQTAWATDPGPEDERWATRFGLSPFSITKFNQCVQANLSGADLRWASLRNANLRLTNLTGARLDGADLSHAVMGQTTLAGLDLSGIRGLETINHIEPSAIAIDTLQLSDFDIPEVFLRGCGVPENIIVYARSLLGRAFEFYSCFISYSSQDAEFAERLYTDLQHSGVRCWFAPHDMRGGLKINEQVDQAIRLHERTLLVLSEHSIRSDWVSTEIAKARRREVTEKRRVLFPIRLLPFENLREWECFDSDIGKDSAREVREYFIPDFSHWKDHDSYQKAFKRLVGDLKAKRAEKLDAEPAP